MGRAVRPELGLVESHTKKLRRKVKRVLPYSYSNPAHSNADRMLSTAPATYRVYESSSSEHGSNVAKWGLHGLCLQSGVCILR